MSDLIDDPTPGENAHEYTVSEISGAVKRVLEGEFGRVRVKGEVGRVFAARSGHLYFDIKDDRNVLAAVSWKGQVARLTVKPEEGMEVVATGRLTTFGSQSKYQLNVEEVRPAGVGALMAMLEKRKKALAAEGLFEESRKKPLPYLPEVIGVVTSPSGAVIRDILHRLRDRFPRKVLIWPVAVQGERCAPEVTRAIEGFNGLTPGGALPRPDLIIVARGGGSIEDLWGFNEESVARAAAASAIPLISAVGHETDTTLIDYVSDRRAPTPTAAAELAVPVRMELMAWADQQEARLSRAMTEAVGRRRQRLGDVSRALPRPETLVAQARQRLDWAGDRLERAMETGRERRRARLAEAAVHLRPGVLRRRVEEQGRAAAACGRRLEPALWRLVREKERALSGTAGRLRGSVLRRDLARQREAFGAAVRRLAAAGRAQVAGWTDRLEGLERLRQSLGYRETLKRGYAVVRGEGRVVTRKEEAEAAAGLEIEFMDGRLKLGGTAGRRSKGGGEPPEQGELF
ncbi:exodeoxyribonuclease VII large subunit [Psychromarinibacter sp. C21-152]|uniref:Exodeoxyribonuclease 7 large subunit n=1 Tax=Psychromarinibacter sediminicola TaxID=3033385 RepID=A0AAE3NQ05_9RHOB|nr:exodeoxyribonuclease VII large subunit [Psychromarinibacter sediminicola]MDF0599981.1 exodeoxyribonuclease VII large subunit [Psychromarinibacter sediminicola]